MVYRINNPNTKYVALICIFLLVSSSLSIADAQLAAINSSHAFRNAVNSDLENPEKNTIVKTYSNYSVSLSETVGIKSNDETADKTNDKTIIEQEATSKKIVCLNEKIGISAA